MAIQKPTKTKPKPLGFDELPDSAFIRPQQLIVERVVPFSITSLWRKIRCAEFPAPDKISDQISAFRVWKVRVWQADPAGFKAKQSMNGGQK